MNDLLRFPDRFLWGTAGAAHQAEGGNFNNDWWQWEQQPGHVRHGHSARVSCDWWNRAEDDFALAGELGHSALRLSLEWSRIEPEPGRFDEAALARYRRMLERLRALGLEPVVCLHHFTLPRWVADKGGFENPWTVERFARFAERAVAEYKDLVRYWLTINEPMIFVALGWFLGHWPPGKHSFPAAIKVARNLVRAHALAYRIAHRARADALVSAAMHVATYVPNEPGSRLDRSVVAVRDWMMNRAWLEAALDGVLRPPLGAFERVPEAVGSHDFIGFQHYYTFPLAFSARDPGALFTREMHPRRPDAPDFMGDPRPEGLGEWASRLARYGKPLMVTENGLLEREERERPAWLVRSLAGLHRAIGAGADVRGYLHWSLVDNFEWAEGYDARFGLVRVDFASQARTVKESGRVFGEIARANGISRNLAERLDRRLAQDLFKAA